MIDSIHIRVNNIQRYPFFLKWLMNKSERTYSEIESSIRPNSEMLFFRLKVQEFHNERKIIKDIMGKKLTSSHYTLAWKLPSGPNASYVEFNFSIPKLLYGTNLIQFVRHNNETSKHLWNYDSHSYATIQRNTYPRLLEFIRIFFSKYFNVTDNPVSFYDIEIRRFDICWEQFFNNKADALKYLNYQKLVVKKHLRLTSKARSNWATSVFFSTKDYGAKIYHKGTEYVSAEGERRKHEQANREMGRMVKVDKDGYEDRNGTYQKFKYWDYYRGRKIRFEVDKIQAVADRVLRYEITFRRSYLSKIFWRKLFRKDNEPWQRRMKKYKEMKRIYDNATGKTHKGDKELIHFWFSIYQGSVDSRSEKVKRLIGYYQPLYRYIKLADGLSKKDKAFFVWWKAQLDKYLNFYLKVPDSTKKNHKGFILYDDIGGTGIERNIPIEAEFSEDLLKNCFKIFDDFREHFFIKEKYYVNDSVKKIEAYNKKIEELNINYSQMGLPLKKKIGMASAKQMLKLMENTGLRELYDTNVIQRTTYNKYKNICKILDVCVNYAPNINIWSCLGFSEYFRSLSLMSGFGLSKYLNNDIFL